MVVTPLDFPYKRINHFTELLDQTINMKELEIAEELKMMFRLVSKSFNKYMQQQTQRRSFVGYHYVLYKLAEIIEYPISIDLCKNTEKMIANDKVWEFICLDNKWKYIPTIQ